MRNRETLLLTSAIVALFLVSAILVLNSMLLPIQQQENKELSFLGVPISEEVVVSSVGHQIRQARIARGMTQQDLAMSVGLSIDNMTTIERGQAVPTRDLIVEIEKILRFEIVMDI